MKPVIKWPGGKTGEMQQILPLMTDYDRYIEPYVGGGSLYFELNPAGAVIADTSAQLICLYQMLQAGDMELKKYLRLYAASFRALRETVCRYQKELLGLYQLYVMHAKADIGIKTIAPHRQLVERIAGNSRVQSELIPDAAEFTRYIANAVEDKLLKTAQNDVAGMRAADDASKASKGDGAGGLAPAQLWEQILTGFMGGYYLYFRKIYNRIAAGEMDCSAQYETANFYFIREYSHGFMFRYNAKGGFNIPYGGPSCNEKDLDEKIRSMYAPERIRLLNRTQITCEGPADMLRALDLTERDFVYLHPPYDTDFAGEEDAAGEMQNPDLSAFLRETKAQVLLVLRNTEKNRELYERDFRILNFENQYDYNVLRKDHNRAEHLVITNIPAEQVPWIRETYDLS